MMTSPKNILIDTVLRTNQNLSAIQIDEILIKTDLKESNSYNMTALMFVMERNHCGKLNLNAKQWGYLIENSDLEYTNFVGNSALTQYIWHAADEKIVLSPLQIAQLIRAQHLGDNQKNEKITKRFLISIFHDKKSFKTAENALGWGVIDHVIDGYCASEPQQLEVLLKNFAENKNQQCHQNYRLYVIEKEKRVLDRTIECSNQMEKKMFK